jgi:2-polyprenyl-3-methyl-5-hydroxy-6-metoxy-1,4-benzoquinol methylase
MEAKSEQYYSRIRKEIIQSVPANKTARVLSLGCGYGLTENILAAEGSEVWGVEMNPGAAARAAQKLTRVICQDADCAIDFLPRGCFDCLILSDILEHLVDPWASLLLFRRTLAPSGVVVASIPNVRFIGVTGPLILRGSWRYAEEGVLDKTHLRFFGKKEIRDLFESAGFESVRVWPKLRNSPYFATIMNSVQRCLYKIPIIEGFLAKQYLVTVRTPG